MIDTSIVATVPPSSTVDRSHAGLPDRDTDNLDRLAASLRWLAHYCYGEPFVIEGSRHLGLEPVGDHKLAPGGAMRVAGQQF